MDRFEIKPLPKKVEEELALGDNILKEIAKHRRGASANMAFIDDSPFKTDLKQLYVLPRRQLSKNNPLDMAFAYGRQLGKYPNPVQLINANIGAVIHIPVELFPEGNINNVEIKMKTNDMPEEIEQGYAFYGYMQIGEHYFPMIQKDNSESLEGEDVLWQAMEWEDCEGSFREPTLDSFSQLRPGYKGGNIPNIFKSMEPCSRINPKDVAKRRAKNKAARKNKRK